MMRYVLTVCMMIALLAGSLLVAADGLAQQAPSSAGSSGPLKTIGGRTCASFNDADGALFGVIVPCLSNTIEIAATDMAYAMVDYIDPIFYFFLTLVVVMHGVTMVQGEGQIGPRTFLLLLKIMAVVAFVHSLGGYAPSIITIGDIYDIMKGTEDIMAEAMLGGGGSQSFACDYAQYLPSNRPGHILWAEMDCALAKILGFALTGSNGQPSMVLAASVLGMLGGFFFGGTFGLAVFFAAVGFLLALIGFVVRVGFAYINAYMVVALYVIISPIFIPLVLFKGTTQYFQNWVKGIAGAVITPVIVTAYSIFALLIFDQMLFREDSVLKAMMNYSVIAEAQRNAKTVDCGTYINDQVDKAERDKNDPEARGNAAMSTFSRNPMIAAFTGATRCEVQVTNLEIARANLGNMSEDDAKKEKTIYTQLMIDLAKMFVLALIITSGWKQISQVLLVLSGSSVAPMAIGSVTPQERAMQSSYANAQAAMKRSMNEAGENGEQMGPGGAAGAAFVDRLVPTLGTGAKTFIEGVGR